MREGYIPHLQGGRERTVRKNLRKPDEACTHPGKDRRKAYSYALDMHWHSQWLNPIRSHSLAR